MLDPTDVVFQNSDAKAFTEWHNAALKLPEDVITPLPTQSKTAAPARWFITILDCQRWLTDDSILQQPNFCDVLHPVIGYATIGFAIRFPSTLDSMCKRRSRIKKVDEMTLNMAKVVPWVCKHADIWKEKKMTSNLCDVWDVEISEKAPQQSNGPNFGIMSLKFMECLISGHDVSVIDPDRCEIF
ncbi:hypothetical protein C2S51_022746 [Perilla frutescens var. frutescens]|nr:hypothetical protein C2S51_022746 [Perilla frutescens var. frutescens]